MTKHSPEAIAAYPYGQGGRDLTNDRIAFDRGRSLHLAATREALAQMLLKHYYIERSAWHEAKCSCDKWVETVQRKPYIAWHQHVADAILAPGGPIQLAVPTTENGE